jgi:STE24 endopeptidase
MTQETQASGRPRSNAEVLSALERAAKSLRRQETALAILSFAVGLAYLVVMLNGFSVELRVFATNPTMPRWVGVGWYLFLFTLLYNIVHFPVSYLRGYVVEKRFRLSTQRFRRWMWSQAKKTFVSAVLVVALGEVVYYFLARFEDTWWVWAWGAYLVFGLLLNRFGARLLLPIFYKRGEIEDVELKHRIEQLVTRAGFEVEAVRRIVLEKDTRRANAAVAGLGKSKEILVSDTLLSGLSAEEIEAVVAHELGHLKQHHGEALFALGMVISFIGFALAAGVLALAAQRLDLKGVADVAGFPLIVLVFAGLFFLMSPPLNYISRQMERAADLWVARFTGKPEALASALEKLAATNLAERDQPWLYEILFSSHPSPGKRVAYLRKTAAKA